MLKDFLENNNKKMKIYQLSIAFQHKFGMTKIRD